jgi:hypothetical protein
MSGCSPIGQSTSDQLAIPPDVDSLGRLARRIEYS